MKKIIYSIARAKTRYDTTETGSFDVIPYSRGISKRIRRVLRRCDVQTVFRSRNATGNFLSKNHTKCFYIRYRERNMPNSVCVWGTVFLRNGQASGRLCV